MFDEINTHKKRHIFIVSDATGSTAETVVKAGLSQFKQTSVTLHNIRYIRTKEDIHKIVSEVMSVDGIIVYTLVSEELREDINKTGKAAAVPTIDVLGPLLTRLTDYLEISPMAVPGLFRHLDKDYYARIECIDFAVKHDDGKKVENLAKAEIVLVGPSRTSKTPISIYLAYRNYRVANVPIILGFDPPLELQEINKNRIIGLFVSPSRLKKIREIRASRYLHTELTDYVDLGKIRSEMNFSMKYYVKHRWDMVDVTSKSIEEAATEIMRIIGKKN
ncbi:MAG: pyruvate, water dikinase regulatory protein [Candidatus Cloacimonadota bacterium]|nr:pyruvate, water dikinase regulatory protein [Candidatus Cloacimonadota bacterium]